MKYLLDTNVIISAMLFPTGTPGQAYDLALTTPHAIVVADYTITELRKVFRLKFPNRQADLEQFLDTMVPGITIVPTPAVVEGVDVERVRDNKDWPIVRAAVAAHVDAIITGDKDLLDAELPSPSVLTPAAFLRSLTRQ
ncbi:MAG: putative toxin-antitoxin system toxin component, PIN family [Propionibacteriaceae bacterium]|nr:putative toxin-antitoxin system toxin component, PIN family [Propionibacteriaceae bacterium]